MTQDKFQWQRHPDAEQLVCDLVEHFDAGALPVELFVQTSSRFVDWLDHLVVADGDAMRGRLSEVGFEPEAVPCALGDTVFAYPGAIFPRLVLRRHPQRPAGQVLEAAIQVEDIATFLMTHHLATPIEGTLLGSYRRALAWQRGAQSLWIVERRGHSGMVPTTHPAGYAARYLDAWERWATRPRHFADRRVGMEQTLALARSLVSDLGVDTAAWVAFAVEREHWQRRNWAGQIQKARQDQLGLGWANHDHHTFRSSRDVFPLLIQILETFGFRPRERFYAGAEAGWGAQVMEQPTCRFAVFADVDLSPEEAAGDFAHEGLAPRNELGTVGLWCALHGESMLSAGLHHLAVRLDFDPATADLAELGVGMMKPFSDFSFLRQAFTRGERWTVPEDRLAALRAGGQIDAPQQARFAEEGAVGSHLENIQRGEGFKGFNQQTVSDIIRRTDPRFEYGAA